MPTNFDVSQFSGLASGLIGLAVLAFFVVRQFSTRRVTNVLNIVVPLGLAIFGYQGLGQLDSSGWVLLGLTSSLGMVLGFARGLTFQVWTDATGTQLMRGTRLTLILWAATIATKIVLSIVGAQLGLGVITSSAALSLIPGAVTLAAQFVVVYLRAQDQKQLAHA